MRTFEDGNWSNGSVCAMCKTSEKGEVVLIPIVGTQEGNNIQATQVHTQCLTERLMYYPDNNIIAGVCDPPLTNNKDEDEKSN